MNDFLSQFRGLLLEFGKSQKEICDDLGIRTQKLSNWKTGYSQPSFDDIIMLANYFNVSVDYLLGRSDDFGNITVLESTPALSTNEEQLLKNFRKLPDELKHRAGVYMEKLVELADEESASIFSQEKKRRDIATKKNNFI